MLASVVDPNVTTHNTVQTTNFLHSQVLRTCFENNKHEKTQRECFFLDLPSEIERNGESGGHFDLVALFEPVPQVQRERTPAESVPKIIFH